MSLNFWKELNRPVFALAPMEDVTDTVFREIVLSLSSPDKLHVLFTEFTSVDGMNHPKGRDVVSQRLRINTGERDLLKEKNVRIVAQLWGSSPEKFYRASKIISEEYNFDGIDINMGCPVKKIVKQGACSALILQPQLAREIIQAASEGSGLPVSVKTRIGFDTVDTLAWIDNLLDSQASAICIHGRTRKMQSEGSADWNEISKSVRLRDEKKCSTLILGNGDVMNIEEAENKVRIFGVDGVMIGRGIFANPWLFSNNTDEKSQAEKIDVLLKHAELYDHTWGSGKNFAQMKRFFKIYLSGFSGAAQLRAVLMNANKLSEVKDCLVSTPLI